MLDIKFVRDNPDAVRENIKKKFLIFTYFSCFMNRSVATIVLL